MSVVIRRATPADIDLVVASRLSFLAEVRGGEVDETGELAHETRFFIETESGADRLISWVAHDEGDFAGIVSLVLWPRPPRPGDLGVTDGYIINMYVPPHHQRRGVGKRLLDECLSSARALGIGRFALHTTDEGRHLYESSGFSTADNWMELRVLPE